MLLDPRTEALLNRLERHARYQGALNTEAFLLEDLASLRARLIETRPQRRKAMESAATRPGPWKGPHW